MKKQAICRAEVNGRCFIGYGAELYDLSDDLLNCILQHLSFEHLASAHLVDRRFHRLLSRPDPSAKVYGSLTCTVDDRRLGLSPLDLKEYLLPRLPGFKAVTFRSLYAGRVESEDQVRMHEFFRVCLPQLAIVLREHHVELGIDVQQGAHVFFDEPIHGDQEAVDQHFRADYWALLAPVTTSVSLRVLNIVQEIPRHRLDWLQSMQKLQFLKLQGDGASSQITLPLQLSLPKLTVLQLKHFNYTGPCHLTCPSLEQLHFSFIQGEELPSGLHACSCLSVLNLAGARDVTFIPETLLFAAVEGVKDLLKELDISGWSLEALPQWFARLPRLHTLHAMDNLLDTLPSLPANLRALDLRANYFDEVPLLLESMTCLTVLRLSSPASSAFFQIRRDLGPIIRLPKLQLLTLALEPGQQEADTPKYKIWNAQSLAYLGRAQYEIAVSDSRLELMF